jgi:hypothetical protein
MTAPGGHSPMRRLEVRRCTPGDDPAPHRRRWFINAATAGGKGLEPVMKIVLMKIVLGIARMAGDRQYPTLGTRLGSCERAGI